MNKEQKAQHTPKHNRWLTADDLAKEYGFSKSTQAKYRMRKEIPYNKIGDKYVRYDRVEIDKWIADKAVALS